MADRDVAQCGEGLVELFGQPIEALGPLRQFFITGAANIINCIVAAPENPVVGRLAQIVKLVPSVGNAITTVPADRLQLRFAPRLTDQYVVVDGDHAGGQVPQQSGCDFGGQGNLTSAHVPVCCA
jgi:hypothetical protein